MEEAEDRIANIYTHTYNTYTYEPSTKWLASYAESTHTYGSGNPISYMHGISLFGG